MRTLALLLGLFAAPAWATCPPPQPGLLLASCAAPTMARLVLLTEEAIPEPAQSGSRLILTGAYTSGERLEPEGLYYRAGAALDPVPQGWDGVALIDADGSLSLHHVARVEAAGQRFNLRDRAQRKAFQEAAAAGGWSALQSHMLVIDGAVDVRPAENAPRAYRRVLFSLPGGAYGVWNSSTRLTLFQAAQEISRRFAPVMALNLDMGSYDFCGFSTRRAETRCGALSRDALAPLSNLIVFDQEPAS